MLSALLNKTLPSFLPCSSWAILLVLLQEVWACRDDFTDLASSSVACLSYWPVWLPDYCVGGTWLTRLGDDIHCWWVCWGGVRCQITLVLPWHHCLNWLDHTKWPKSLSRNSVLEWKVDFFLFAIIFPDWTVHTTEFSTWQHIFVILFFE